MANVLTNRMKKMCLALNALLAQTTPTLPEQQDSLSELAEIKSTLVVLRGHLKELEDIIAAMNKIDEDWALALSQAAEADKTRMARIYDKDQEDYQCEVMTTRALEARRGLLELIRKFTSREVMLATTCQQGESTSFLNRSIDPTMNQMLNQTVQPVSLPMLASPKKFSGKIRHWREFIESFNATVGNSNIEAVHKFNHLLGLLEGEALDLVRYLRPSADNYKIALDMLTERYDDKETLTGDLIQRFHSLKPCQTFSDVRQFQLELELICRQLEALGAELNNPIICSSLENKLSFAMLKEIKKAKRNNPAWNTKLFREKLKQMVRDEETNERAYGLQHVSNMGQRPRDPRVRRDRSPTLTLALPKEEKSVSFQRPTIRPTIKSPSTSIPRPPPNPVKRSLSPPSNGSMGVSAPKVPNSPCFFCFEMHWTVSCAKFKTFPERLNRARELRLCSRCLSRTHAPPNCQNREHAITVKVLTQRPSARNF
uniref:Uncharacterized protein n=1 Tax=Meloidogyne enterolobii TaxID=390850 RepID=A0A6V7WSY2_MELEN|nr:unnamed protein product [Meloidogyne enterolobii]